MLTGRCAAGTLALSCFAGAASAAPGDPIVISTDNFGGAVETTVTSPGTLGGARPSGQGTSTDGVTCSWTQLDGMAQGFAISGGSWYDIVCSDGTWRFQVFVPDAAGNVPAPVVEARTLAEEARSRLQLPGPKVGQSPAGRTLVGLPTWWWVAPGSWQVLRQRTEAGPVWAEVTASPVSTSWDPGDGSAPVVCAGPGTRYDRARPESEQSTDCSYVYRRSSADQPQTGPDVNDRFFTVTVTTVWDVSWTGSGGSGGSLPQLTRSSTFPLAVAQRQTVNTGGSG
jgi:hypothetical protein